MPDKTNKLNLILALLSFALPFSLYVATSSDTLMFDDSAEFATVISLGSIAHPPGTPAYILTGMIWKKVSDSLGLPFVLSLTLYSGFCISLASVFLFLAFRKILSRETELQNKSQQASLTAFFTALAFSTGATTWAWANTIEVYAFQCLAFAICLYGLIQFHFDRSWKYLLIAAIGIGAGLSNHHVTMIFFLPFIPFFFIPALLTARVNDPKQKKKSAANSISIPAEFVKVFRQKQFWVLTGMTGIIAICFYSWMFIRAQEEYLFMFSKPDTLDNFIFHLRGGAYTKNLTDTSASIISARIPFFLKLTLVQLGVFTVFLFMGIYSLIKSKRGAVAVMVITYFLFLFIYQINNNQWASTDAYMLLPFMFLLTGALFGLKDVFSKWKLAYILPVILLAGIVYHYPLHNRKSYPVGNELMQLLDKSAPPNSIVLISDWSTVMLYNYYRLIENFRSDLIVLNYDIKFTHYRILPLQYPEFYGKIRKEYDHFVDELRKEHPYQVITTGCDLSTNVLMNSFTALIQKIEEVARSGNRALLTDPRAHIFYRDQGFYNPNRYVSGAYMSSISGDSSSAAHFLSLNFKFLDSKLLLHDAGALDKLVDFQAMLDQHKFFYKANNDALRLGMAESAYGKVMSLQRKMRESMSFAYKVR